VTVELTREIRDNRIAVAKDVLARIALRKLELRIGSYITLRNCKWLEPEACTKDRKELGALFDETSDLQTVVDQLEAKCAVCLRGAAVLSKARVLDKIPMRKVLDARGEVTLGQGDTTDLLSDIFDPKQLDLFEAAFERVTHLGGGWCTDEELLEAQAFGTRHTNYDATDEEDAASITVAVMQNLIDNDGVFRPELVSSYQSVPATQS
jgi:hypothetical protein